MVWKSRFIFTVAAAVAAAPASASVNLDGNYINTTVNDLGTLGNGYDFPGLIHDPTGTGTFDPANDYIRPGTPHEGFVLRADQFGYSANSNYGAANFFGGPAVVLTGAAANGYQNAATWTGSNGFVSVTNSYFFNNGDQRILITTVLTALTAVSNLALGRSVDPDPDAFSHGSFDTNNQRGNSLYGVDDFVGSAGAISGLTLALINLSGNAYQHAAQINAYCCDAADPYSVLAGPGPLGNSSTGDYGLNMAWRIGTLAAGSSATINYAYAVGDKIATVGGTGAIPEPATWAMMIVGFGAMGAAMRRARRHILLPTV